MADDAGDNEATAYEVTINSGTGVLTANAWKHVAIVRDGSTFRLFVGGVLTASATWTGAIDWHATIFHIGKSIATTSSYHGYIDEFRATEGVARYTANFIPPTAPFPSS